MTQIRERLVAARAHLHGQFCEHGAVGDYLRDHRTLVDRVIRQIWRDIGISSGTALLAVGGYGRGELFPHSDVDILVLLRSEPSPQDTAKLEVLIGRLWDEGLEVGHSVRTVVQCVEEARKDLTVQTALIESRLVTGSRSLFQELCASIYAGINRQSFFSSKRMEQEQRHAKYQDTPFSLEPNLKESPGALRDLQMILWIARASLLGSGWKDLASKGLITTGEAHSLSRYARFLKELRVRLHFAAGRREDRLLFEYQAGLAQDMGYCASTHRRTSEQLMEDYYRTAKSVTQLNTIMLQNLSLELFPESVVEPRPIDHAFSVVHEHLDANDPRIFENEPSSILRCFLILQQRPELKGMTAPTLRGLWRARYRIDRQFRSSRTNRELFLSILQQPRGLVYALRRMNQYSILGRYLPVFGKVVGQMQHDLFHVFTVDQHILMVIRNLRRFTKIEFAHEFPLCSRLISGFERTWLLYVAAIFHDIAKGRGGDHSLQGQLEAKRFCREHRITGEDANLVEFLVQRHLLMSSVAQKQDLSDPTVIDRFLESVQTERNLVALYLLTVADIRGTSPKVWNAWKGKLLEELFHTARRRMLGAPVALSESIQSKQDEARRLLRLYALENGVETALWQQLDTPYFLRHEAHEIAWQTRLLFARVRSTAPIVRSRLSPIGEGLQVMIYAMDQPNLFARICGFIDSIAYSVVDAKIHTTRHGYALDTFQIMGMGRSGDYRDMIRLVEHDLQSLLENVELVRPRSKGRVSRQLKHFPITPEVHIRPDENGAYYFLAIIAGDRPGLLYSIAQILGKYRVNLHTAKIATLGDRAEDSFLVSGDALSQPHSVLLLEQDLLQALQA